MIKRLLLALLALTAVASVGFCGVEDGAGACLDNNITGQKLTDQFDQYKDVRDQVESIQNGETKASAQELQELVLQEANLAVKSWVRAACFCYAGLLASKSGNDQLSKECYAAALKYSQLAQEFENDTEDKVKESDEQGKKFEAIATKHLR